MIYDIQNNAAALTAERNLEVSSSSMKQSLQRLSSGYRINSASDDAAGMAISNGLTANIASANIAQQNISQATSLLQVADGAMSSVGDILTRMKELATEAASANVGSDVGALSNEYNTLVSEIDRIANSTQYSGTNLVDGTFGSATSGNNTTVSISNVSNIYNLNVSSAALGSYTVSYVTTGAVLTLADSNGDKQNVALTGGAQTVNFSDFGISFQTTTAAATAAMGAALAADTPIVVAAGAGGGTDDFQIGYAGETNNTYSVLGVSINSIKAVALGLANNDISTAPGAQTKMDTIDAAITTLSSDRASIGAYENRLTYAGENLTATIQNFTAANSAIKDVDMASEMTNFTKQQILVQAGTAMLAQANTAPQQVLALFK
jgi:flagellin